MSTTNRLIPIYTSRGDLAAFLLYPYLYSRQGEWIGWIAPDKQVYSVHGHYVGWLADGPRILRKLADSFDKGRITIKPPPSLTITPPAYAPLAPMMSELTFGIIDVLEDAQDLMPSVDFGDLREDMD
jgi:hypothetical protein